MPLAYITVKQPDGMLIHLDVDLRTSVQDFKSLLASKCHVPRARQRLLFSGRVLQDGQVLEACGLSSGTTVYLMVSGGEDQVVADGNIVYLPTSLDAMQTHLLQNLDIMQAMMDSNAMASLLEDPELLSKLLKEHPSVQELTKKHPDFGAMLRSEEFRKSSAEAFGQPGSQMKDMLFLTDRGTNAAFTNEENFELLQSLCQSLEKKPHEAARGGQHAGGEAGADGEDVAGDAEGDGPPAWAGTFDPNAMVAMMQDPSMQQLLSQLVQTMGPPGRKPDPDDPWLEPEFYARLFQVGAMTSMVTMQQAMNGLNDEVHAEVAKKEHGDHKKKKDAAKKADKKDPTSPTVSKADDKPSSGETAHPSTQNMAHAASLSGLHAESPAANFASTFSVIMAAQQENPEVLYKGQLQAMQNMGFTEKESCIRLLHKFGGNMQKAIDALMLEQHGAPA